jgi:hypothetical protein
MNISSTKPMVSSNINFAQSHHTPDLDLAKGALGFCQETTSGSALERRVRGLLRQAYLSPLFQTTPQWSFQCFLADR